MTQFLIVALIVVAALVYSAWVLMPAAWRRAAAAHLAQQAARRGVAPRHASVMQARLERAGSCGECASCKACASSSPVPRL